MTSRTTTLFESGTKVFLRSMWQEGVSIDKIRRRMARLDKMFGFRKPDAVCTPVDADGVPCQWVRANGVDPETDRVLYYIHGGGFSTHLPRVYTHFTADLSALLGARVLLVDYRLAPEHPFPAAPDDCLSAYRWLTQQTDVDGKKLLIAGDSAGGNLSLVTLLMAKETGLPLPSAGWIISPAVDCDWSHSALEELQATDPMFSTQALAIMEPYFGAADRRDPRISPINGDLAGLPPLLIEAGGREMFREQPDIFAGRAREAGASVIAHVWEGMPHCFQVFSFLPEARLARDRACRFMQAQSGLQND